MSEATVSRSFFQRNQWDTGSKPFFALVVAALLIGLVRRLILGWETPLWLDETFTGAMAIRPGFGNLVADMLRDVPGPVYYTLMWAWEKVAGAGNISLRLPSFLFAIAAPLVALLRWNPDRTVRLLWATLLALWLPGFHYATEARAYSLLFLLGTVQAILFCRLLDQPTLRRAASWAAVGAVMALSHYHSLLLTGLQGLTYLACWRGRSLRTWPAALFFLPVAAWMVLHFELLRRFSDPRFAWQSLLSGADLIYVPALVAGLRPKLLAAPALIVAGTMAWDGWNWLRRRPRPSYRRTEVLAALVSLAAVAAIFAAGFVRPNFSPRYLVPFMPGVLLGIAIWARAWSDRWRPLPWVLVAAMSLATIQNAYVALAKRDFRHDWSWQAASDDLREARIRRIFFLWDNPMAEILEPDLLSRVGAFFFTREGVEVETRALLLGVQKDVDPNLVLLRHAGRQGDAIIWGYDRWVKRTLAIKYPPRISRIDPRWQCRSYSQAEATSQIYVCIYRGGPDADSVRVQL